jgi:hypothetical protein
MDEAKLGKGRISMHIYVDLHKHYNGETDEDNLRYFKLILDKLEKNGFHLNWSRKHLESGSDRLAIITSEFPRDPGRDDDTTKEIRTHQSIMAGAMFCTWFKNQHPLSLKRLFHHLDEIVLKDNRTLLYQLYEMEYKERYRKPRE